MLKNTLYDVGKSLLRPFPKTKFLLKRGFRDLRTSFLKMRYPDGAYLECNGCEVYCDFSSDNYAWYDGNSEYMQFELDVFMALFERRKPNVVLDVGAHWGFYPAYLEKHASSRGIRKVIAIEADPVNQPALSKTLSRIRHIPVVQINSAVSDKNGYVDLFKGGGSCGQTYRSATSVLVGKIGATTLDTLMAAHLEAGDEVTHIKLDIDGYEPAFFEGGVSTLANHSPSILMEFWAKGLISSGYKIESFWAMLHGNYEISEACHVTHSLKALERVDLPYLIEKTMSGITNLVLIPRNLKRAL